MKLSFEKLGKIYGGQVVFTDISGEIDSGDIIGLIGVNGVGKTTLARILGGLEPFDSGQVNVFPSSGKVLYVEQFPAFEPDVSVYEEVFRSASVGMGEKTSEVSGKVKKVLNKMGMEETMWNQKAASLSGGEKTKLSLCRAMVREFDFLLLDEPSNHLDMESCQVLEEYLLGLGKPVLAISHDRYFLDTVANKIWELTGEGLKVYEGNYSDHKKQKEIETRNAEKEYEKQQARIEHLKRVISDRKNWYASAHKGAGQNDFYRSKAKKHASVIKAKERELEKLEENKLERPGKDVSPAFEVINKNVSPVKFPPVLMRGENLSKSFGEKVIFDNASFCIGRGEKVALVGPNGAGKTTFLRMVCGLDRDFLGTISITPSVKVGYFAQELDGLDEEASILEYAAGKDIPPGEARLLLASLHFRRDEVFKRIGDLSMGEKGRTAFARLILSGANMLVLDEPTNYMDIVSREKIEEVLREFNGSILFVSHDRYFIKRLATKIFRKKDQKIVSYEGGFDYYLQKSREEKEIIDTGGEYKTLTDDIRRLECRLAFLSGQINQVQDEEEKQRIDLEFIKTARELNAVKAALEKNRN